jgi:hypothetical protein
MTSRANPALRLGRHHPGDSRQPVDQRDADTRCYKDLNRRQHAVRFGHDDRSGRDSVASFGRGRLPVMVLCVCSEAAWVATMLRQKGEPAADRLYPASFNRSRVSPGDWPVIAGLRSQHP